MTTPYTRLIEAAKSVMTVAHRRERHMGSFVIDYVITAQQIDVLRAAIADAEDYQRAGGERDAVLEGQELTRRTHFYGRLSAWLNLGNGSNASTHSDRWSSPLWEVRA